MKILFAFTCILSLLVGFSYSADCHFQLATDINGDCKTDLADFVMLAQDWLLDCNNTPNDPKCIALDIDEDGFDAIADCNDNDPNIYPGAIEIPNDGIDQDCDGSDSFEIIWVSINDPGVDDDGDGTPDHEPFNGEMSKYETTNAQYCEYLNAALATYDITVGSDGYVYGANGTNSGEDFVGFPYYYLFGSGYTFYGATNGGASRINFNDGVFTVDQGFENHPVTYVKWHGATVFCNYYGWRLPTEWEWRAVADHQGEFSYGCGPSINNNIANYFESTHPDGTTVVGSFGTFGYGMSDMAGNVCEWTSSCYQEDCTIREYVMKGGGWSSWSDTYCLVFFRNYDPFISHVKGFRVCR